MADEGKQRRSRRRRRPRSGDAAAPRGEGGNARRSRQGGKGRSRGGGRSNTSGRRQRRDRSPSNWWTKRWSSSLDSIQVGRRLGHGRTYARQGRVIEVEYEKGSVTAMVQGSRDAPDLVRMHFAVLSAADWRRFIGVVGADTELGGGLFRGEFPEQADAVFTGLDLSLFPSGQGDLKAACSCPDQANPCKHVAAVYYALGEAIDRNPFLLFQLRGLDRTALMEALARTPAARTALVAAPVAEAAARREDALAGQKAADQTQSPTEAEGRQRPEEPLAPEPQSFWAGPGGDGAEEVQKEVRIPRVSGALAQRLGGYPFWRGPNACSVIIDQIYRASSPVGLSIYLGESDPEKSE
jgi:uncharacterized Zn finger protein